MEERHNIPTELISAMAPSQGMDAFSDEVSLMLMEGNPVASTTGGFGKKKMEKRKDGVPYVTIIHILNRSKVLCVIPEQLSAGWRKDREGHDD